MNLSEQLMIQNRDARAAGSEIGGSFWSGFEKGQQEALLAPTRRLQQDLLGLQVGAAREAETVNQQLHKDIPGIVQAFGEIPVDDPNARHEFIAQHAGLAVTPMGKALLSQLSDTADSMDKVYAGSVARQKQLLQVKDDLEAYQLGYDLTNQDQREAFYERRRSIDTAKQDLVQGKIDLLDAQAKFKSESQGKTGVDSPFMQGIRELETKLNRKLTADEFKSYWDVNQHLESGAGTEKPMPFHTYFSQTMAEFNKTPPRSDKDEAIPRSKWPALIREQYKQIEDFSTEAAKSKAVKAYQTEQPFVPGQPYDPTAAQNYDPSTHSAQSTRRSLTRDASGQLIPAK